MGKELKQDEIISAATLNNWSRLNVSSATIKEKLSKRANKRLSTKNIIPTEYFSNKKNIQTLVQLVSKIQNEKYDIETSIYNLAINLLYTKKLITISNSNIKTQNPHLEKILNSTFNNIKLHEELLKFNLPSDEKDILGLIYQSLLQEGRKNKQGSYYTPDEIIKSIIQNVNPNTKFLDPCCGTGSFLLGVSDKITNPEYIFGCDIDKIACFIAKVNLIIKFKDTVFEPKIFNIDILTNSQILRKETFDIIATNPPWGSMTSSEYKNLYPNITSGESFSYFIVKSSHLLSKKGICIFVLPESILNVTAHKDIREFILGNFQIKQIQNLGKIFTGVLSDVVLLNLQKTNTPDKNHVITIINSNNKQTVHQCAYYSNKNFNFTTISDFDAELLKKIYSIPHTDLSTSIWGLGIVTGNNKKHLTTKVTPDNEKIYTGKEVAKYKMLETNKFITYNRKAFQQTAPENIYRAEEKLIYKFISKKLTFAYDNTKSLVLNSANILIPNVTTHSIKTVLAFLNSELFQYIYCKKFNELKILKGNLVQLPFPIINQETKLELENYVNNILQQTQNVSKYKIETDEIIYRLFSLSEEEKQYIKNSI